jgi:hypothetical protein
LTRRALTGAAQGEYPLAFALVDGMSPRKRDMLEAFRTAADPGAAPAEPAASQPPPKPARPQAPPARLPASPIAFPTLPRWLPWVALVGVAFVIGLTIGLGRRGTASAAAPGDDQLQAQEPPASAEPEPSSAAPDAGDPGSASPVRGPSQTGEAASEAALYDPRNQYCVVVASYGASADGLAWATYDHLREARLPVFAPLDVGNQIVVLAGAAPRSEDLAALEETIQGLSRDGRPRAYADAYRRRIDAFIRRP